MELKVLYLAISEQLLKQFTSSANNKTNYSHNKSYWDGFESIVVKDNASQTLSSYTLDISKCVSTN